MSAIHNQKRLFDYLKARLGKDWLLELCEVMGLGKSALYKRIKGEIMLSFDELGKLVSYYNISMDRFLTTNNLMVGFKFSPLYQQPASFSEFLHPIINNLKQLVQLEYKKVFYASNEIPIFHYLHFPELTLFKLYVWGRTVWGLKNFQGINFNLNEMMTKDLKINMLQTLRLYSEIPSIEFWSINILDNTLNQIKYYASAKLFDNPDEVKLLYRQIEELRVLLLNMAKTAKKLSPLGEHAADFTLYHNEMLHTNNIILVNTSYGDGIYVTYDNPNFLFTDNPELCRYTSNWFQKLKRNSQCISLESERDRLLYFDELKRKIVQTGENMEFTFKY